MLKRKRQKKYLKKRWTRMLKHLYTFLENNDPEGLHQMRVEIKKINAMIILSTKCSTNDYVKEKLGVLKNIYNQAGKIRSVHVNLQLISSYKNIDKKFTRLQQRSVLTETNKLCALLTADNKGFVKTNKIISKSLFHIKNKLILNFYRIQVNKISKLLTGSNRDSRLHKSRKKIQRLLHIYDFLQKSLQNNLGFNIPYFREIVTLIGNWHDYIITLGLLKKTGFAEKYLIQRLENQIEIAHKQIILLTENFSEKIFS